jgi:hypothetical protein
MVVKNGETVEPKTEVEEPKQDKKEIDLEAYAEAVIAEQEPVIREKLKQELEVNKDEIRKNIREEIMSEINQKKEEAGKTEEQIQMSNLKRLIEEQAETIKFLKDQTIEQAEKVKQSQIKEEINKRVEKEPYLKKVVEKYLENGTIKSLEDYDKVIHSDLRKMLKDKAEIEEQVKNYGQDPRSGYDDENTSKGSKNWKEQQKNQYQEEVNKMLGIR